jgi:tetratricopeptide (TPR) repeat protein
VKYLLILSFLATVGLSTNIANAKSSDRIKRLAQSVTVAIENQQIQEVGSGFVIRRQGDLYTIVTNRHVVCKITTTQKCIAPPANATYLVTTPDGQQHPVTATAVKILGTDLDLAIVQFRSPKPYAIAQIDTSASLKADDVIYTMGFPATKPGFQFNDGQALVVVRKRLPEDRGGYTIAYDAATLPGMSGSAVFDRQGRVVAIHGQGDRYRNKATLTAFDNGQEGMKVGTNRGIPVETLVRALQQIGIKIAGNKTQLAATSSQTNADEYVLRGYNKWIESNDDTDPNEIAAKRRAAIQFYDRAIALNPKQAKAHLMRGFAYLQLQEFDRVMPDYDLAISSDGRYAMAYYARGNFKMVKLKDFASARADYDRALAIKPTFSGVYLNRGDAKMRLGDFQGALSDTNRAISIEPENPTYYALRAMVKLKLNDRSGATADLDRILKVDLDANGVPRNPASYYFSGALKKNFFEDRSGALEDLGRARDMFQELEIADGSLLKAIETQLEELGVVNRFKKKTH